MKNCIILGSGRSGTSMAMGVLAKTGYFMGGKLYPANETNPKGQFEDRDVNHINEELLSQILPVRPSGILGELFFKSRPVFRQRWLARVPLDTHVPSPSGIEKQIKVLTNRRPFCFKDPRFSYTLPVWRPFIKNVVFICVFRHPGITVTSILNECKQKEYLKSLSLNSFRAFQVWGLMYTHILRTHRSQGGDWLFLHYNQFFDGTAFGKLEKTLGVKVDRDFTEAGISHSEKRDKVPSRILSLYDELCGLADYCEKG